eukprot:203438-Chlamydomonas_euryale.AAC.1
MHRAACARAAATATYTGPGPGLHPDIHEPLPYRSPLRSFGSTSSVHPGHAGFCCRHTLLQTDPATDGFCNRRILQQTDSADRGFQGLRLPTCCVKSRPARVDVLCGCLGTP